MRFQPSSHYRLPLLLIGLCLLLLPMFGAAQAEMFTTETVASPTPRATSTSTFALNEQPVPLETAIISNADTAMATMIDGVNVRRGPGIGFQPPIGSFAINQTSEILAISLDGAWYKVKYYNAEGWILGRLMTVSGNIANLPVEVGPPIISKDEWAPLESEFDGVTMVLVPAGCFMMGSNDGEDDEQPVHEQCFDQPFWIDKYEVTQAQFRRLGGIQANASRFSGDDRPVEQITWFEARDFCELRDSRLPTEKEWEYAARGPDNLVYPWGDEFVANNVVYSQNSNNQTADVGSRPGGVAWVGALDMSGNVWEWTSSLYESYPYAAADGREADTGNSTDVRRVLRGGSWNNPSVNLHAANRNWFVPYFMLSLNGFRCSRSWLPLG